MLTLKKLLLLFFFLPILAQAQVATENKDINIVILDATSKKNMVDQSQAIFIKKGKVQWKDKWIPANKALKKKKYKKYKKQAYLSEAAENRVIFFGFFMANAIWCGFDVKNTAPKYELFEELKVLDDFQRAYADFLFGSSRGTLHRVIKANNQNCPENLKKDITQTISSK